jgi:hypothetical protein
MTIGSEVIHRIVAYAFIGEPPTSQHVADHIDTNRRNNRPENLRWLTKLENTLNNPITFKKIIFLCGSIEAFIGDPSILRQHVKEDPNFEWMRTVTPEEAKISWHRLMDWAKKDNCHNLSPEGSIGEWIFRDKSSARSPREASDFIVSLTPGAIQKGWRSPSEFPCCPQVRNGDPIESYAANLKPGEEFSKNTYSTTEISDFSLSSDRKTLWIISKNRDETAVKPWALAQITYENNLFVHTSLGTFFEKIGVEKRYTMVRGLEWTGGNSTDDYC